MKKRRFNMEMCFPVYYGKTQKVLIRSVYMVDRVEKHQIGEKIGYVRIVYPISGVDCHLDLELYKQPFDLAFKIPFVNDKTFLVDLFVQKQIDEEEEEAKLYEESLEDCSCGGKMLPVYDEHPN